MFNLIKRALFPSLQRPAYTGATVTKIILVCAPCVAAVRGNRSALRTRDARRNFDAYRSRTVSMRHLVRKDSYSPVNSARGENKFCPTCDQYSETARFHVEVIHPE